jgi:hypothetical protein
MQKTFRVHTKVLPGNRIEISANELSVGEEVDVTISPAVTSSSSPLAEGESALNIIESRNDRSAHSMLDFVESLPAGPRLFKTSEEADAYLEQERDSWDT